VPTFFKKPPAGFCPLISGVLARLGAAIGPEEIIGLKFFILGTYKVNNC